MWEKIASLSTENIVSVKFDHTQTTNLPTNRAQGAFSDKYTKKPKNICPTIYALTDQDVSTFLHRPK